MAKAPATANQTIATAETKAAPSEWRSVADAPIDTPVVGKRVGEWIGAICQFNGVEWHYLSAPDIAHSNHWTLNPMKEPTHWKPVLA